MPDRLSPTSRRNLPTPVGGSADLLLALAAVLCVAFLAALIVVAPEAGAQDDEHADDPPIGVAETSPVAVPFVGTAEMWCTDRNPSPGTCRSHHGSPAIDVGMDVGRPLYATGAGTVLQVEAECSASWCRGGAGLFVEIGHADGHSSRYLHLSEVHVEADQVVEVGEQIGLSGNSGSSRSPHLHYDEHFPRGTRTPLGPMLACIDGEVVEYPAAFGYDDWNDVPYGTLLVNDNYECLGGATLAPPTPPESPSPDLLLGPNTVGIRYPADVDAVEAEIELTTTADGSESSTTHPLSADRLLRLPLLEEAEYSTRQRVRIDGDWVEWSNSIELAASPESAEATCFGLFASGSEGTDRIDVLIGTDGDDTIDAGGGNDYICSGGGHDVIAGGDGNDWIDAGKGRDVIGGGAGRDRIFAGPGADYVDGGPARDRIVGGGGADEIIGGAGADVIVGNSGDDALSGMAGRDRIRGGRGDDDVTGGGGHDRLEGNEGADILDGGSGVDVCLDGVTAERCE